MKRMFLVCSLLTAVLAAGPAALPAQGVTTASLTGTITGPNGIAVEGARVSAVHQPSGTAYRSTARAGGRFTIPGMRVGGPYVVTATSIGFQPQTRGGVFLTLGVTADVAFALTEAAVHLEQVTVTAQSGALSSTRTGAATTVSRAALDALPTISRTINDFTRLTPQASGSSFAGQDNRFNNITVDGSYFKTRSASPASRAAAPASRRSRSTRSIRSR